MKSGLQTGFEFEHAYVVPATKTVRHLFTESPEFAGFPEVFATGFMVGLMEWTCTRSLAPYLDDGEGSLGIHICVGHTAATPPGLTVRGRARLTSIDGRRLTWEVSAHDGIDEIGRGTHQRAIIDLARFEHKLAGKVALR